MGQLVRTLMWGTRPSKRALDRLIAWSDEDACDLLYCWNARQRSVASHAAVDESGTLVGVLLYDPERDDGAPMKLDALRCGAKARRTYAAFSEWCGARGVRLGEPTLWLCMVEIA